MCSISWQRPALLILYCADESAGTIQLINKRKSDVILIDLVDVTMVQIDDNRRINKFEHLNNSDVRSAVKTGSCFCAR